MYKIIEVNFDKGESTPKSGGRLGVCYIPLYKGNSGWYPEILEKMAENNEYPEGYFPIYEKDMDGSRIWCKSLDIAKGVISDHKKLIEEESLFQSKLGIQRIIDIE